MGCKQLYRRKWWNVSYFPEVCCLFLYSHNSIAQYLLSSYYYYIIYSVTIEYTNKWYVNQEEQICQQDCLEDPSSPTCGGAVESWNGLYGSVEACCTHKLYWVSPSTCVQQSALQSVTGTEKWYVDWILQKCVKDCDSGEGCGGLAMTFNTLYEDVDICCSMIFWKDRSECL